jgi:hypothetical protein
LGDEKLSIINFTLLPLITETASSTLEAEVLGFIKDLDALLFFCGSGFF